MIIAVDQEIPYREEAFSQFGQIRPFSGRHLKPEDVRQADALIVRSITPVDRALLDGSAVRFVGAASAGYDHVDQDYLAKKGIQFAYAAGCNADSVSEYIAAALHIIAAGRDWSLDRKSIAVIGVGNVGSRVARKAEALGMEVLLCDPPLRDLTGERRYRPFEEVIGADILTFHVPLTAEGPYPTRHMLDRDRLRRLPPGQFVINTSRGAVIDGRELKASLSGKRIAGAVLDVWEDEPVVDYQLLRLLDIGTPHIAGTSIDGKIQATEIVREQLGSFLGIESKGIPKSVYPPDVVLHPESGSDSQQVVASLLRQVLDLTKTDRELRALEPLPAAQAAAGFDRMRKEYPLRLEFRHFVVDLGEKHAGLARKLQGLGFKVRIGSLEAVH